MAKRHLVLEFHQLDETCEVLLQFRLTFATQSSSSQDMDLPRVCPRPDPTSLLPMIFEEFRKVDHIQREKHS